MTSLAVLKASNFVKKSKNNMQWMGCSLAENRGIQAQCQGVSKVTELSQEEKKLDELKPELHPDLKLLTEDSENQRLAMLHIKIFEKLVALKTKLLIVVKAPPET